MARAGYLVQLMWLLMLLAVAGLGWFGYTNFYTPGLQATLTGHQGEVICLAFAPDGNTLATGGQDGTIGLWDLSTRKERTILSGHKDVALDVAFSPDGKLVASAGGDGSVRLWDTGTGEERAALVGNGQAKANGKPLPVLAIAFSPDGQFLVSGGSDKTVSVWDVAAGKQRAEFQVGEKVCSLVITADDKLLVTRTDHGTITVRELNGGKELKRFGDHPWHSPRRLCSVLVSSDGKTVASNGTIKPKIKLWDLTTGEEWASLKADLIWQDWPVYSMAFTPDGKILAGTTMTGARMLFWDISSGQLLDNIHFPPKTLYIAISLDGKTLASAHADGTVKLWEWEKLVPKK